MDGTAVVGPDGLDLVEYARLQEEAYAEILARSGTASFLRPEYYAWKYRPPAGPARIAVVRDGGRLVAANAMFPVTVSDGARSVVAWQSCDTATHPSARGRGLFTRCIDALRGTLGDDTVFFGFPNRNSIGGFLKLGWRVRADVDTFARPLPLGATRRFGDVRPLAAGEDLAAFARGLCAAAGPAVVRDAAYLAWRYAAHPVHRYETFVLGAAGAVRGVVVLRETEVGRRRLAAVLEAAAPDASDVRRLLRFASAWARGRGLRWSVCLGSALRASDALRAGYARVPRALLPKRQVLLGAARGATAESLWARPWNVQLGDWDAF